MKPTRYDPKMWDDVDAHLIKRDGGTLLAITGAVLGGLLVKHMLKKQDKH